MDTPHKPSRNVKGQFEPGISGNPNGRKPLQHYLNRVMTDNDWEILLTKAKKRAMDDRNPQAVKYLEILLDRAHGKVPQQSNVNLSGSISIESTVKGLEALRNKKKQQEEG